MKKILFLITLFSLTGMLYSQDLMIFCDPGYRVYIDGNYEGTTNEAEEGLHIVSITIGEHSMELRKGKEVEAFDLRIESGYNEFNYADFKDWKHFRTDGYYVALLGERPSFNSRRRMEHYVFMYFGVDNPTTHEVELRWCFGNIVYVNSVPQQSFEDYYGGVFKNKFRHNINNWGGYFDIDEDLEYHFFGDVGITSDFQSRISCGGYFVPSGGFRLKMNISYRDNRRHLFADYLDFEFYPMSY